VRLWALTGLLAVLVAGCGTTEPTHTTTASDDLTVYTSLPMRGPQAARSRDVLDGERLALLGENGRVGPYSVRLRPLDDATTKKDGWDPEATLDAAQAAVEDPSTIAYIGDLEAEATALSLPTTNERDLLQVIPAATYDGFSGGDGKAPGEPEKYQPTGQRTFGLVALSDEDQARAIVEQMADDGCQRVALLRAPSGFDASLSELVAKALTQRAIPIVYDDRVRDDAPDTHAKVVTDVVQADADCATFSGGPADAPGSLLRALHAANNEMLFVLPAALADDGVARSLGEATSRTTVVGPAPAPARLAAAFEHRFGRRPGPWMADGYEAMRRVLQAIDQAGSRGNDRRAVVAAFLALPAPRPGLALWRPTRQGLAFARVLAQA
jgi:branched-chain amino acid transport system substrate-binding protein